MPSRSGARTSRMIRLFRGLIKKLAVYPTDRVPMRYGAIADEFLKASRTITNEIEFGKAAQSDL